MSRIFAFGLLLKAAKSSLTRLSKSSRAGKQLRRARFTPRLEILEDRSLPSTFTVLNLHDSGAGSLRQAVLDANAHAGADTIDFAHELHGTIRLTSGELLISDSVTINGPGEDRLSVSGNDASRIFDLTSGQNVTISGLTITDGYALDQGGGILNQGSNLNLFRDDLTHNVVFEGTTTGGRGGALRSLGGNLTITDCQITDNQALGAAGASAFGDGFGGGLYIGAGSATISDSTISGNLARGGNNSSDGFAGGGGILTLVPTTITASTTSDNLAQAGDNTPGNGAVGGGLYIAGAFAPCVDHGSRPRDSHNIRAPVLRA